jgi:hypothetical protein
VDRGPWNIGWRHWVDSKGIHSSLAEIIASPANVGIDPLYVVIVVVSKM